MGFSLSSHGKKLDVGAIGILHEQLPASNQAAPVADDAEVAAANAEQAEPEAAQLPKVPHDVAEWFAPERRGLPMEVEIGCGKGTFIVEQASAARDVNFIGIEWAKQFWRYAADRCRRRGLDANVRMVRTEAAAFMRNFIPNQSIRVLHVYFPDPWPKKKHNKRRLIQESFLRDAHRFLIAGGEVRLATDHADYFAWMEEHAAKVTDIFERREFSRPGFVSDSELVGTNFERKYRREGRTFNSMVLVKK